MVARTAGQTERWIFFGSSGFGKTTLARRIYSARVQPGRGRGIVVDRKGELSALGRVVPSIDAIRANLDAAKGGPVSLVLQPGWGEDVSGLWRLVYEEGRSRRGLLLFVDEMQVWGGHSGTDKDFLELIVLARGAGVDFMGTTHRPTSIVPIFRSLYTRVITFAQPLKEDAQTMADAYLEAPHLAATVKELPHFHYLTRQFGGAVTRGGPNG